MKFSVIIPAYNRRPYIREAIDSVLAQTYPAHEIIIVDDGSTDHTGQFINDLYGNCGQVKYFFRENQERGAARNFGIRKASGDYAVFFDSDDWMKPACLQILQDAITEKGQPVMLAAKYGFRSDDGKEWGSDMQAMTPGWYGLDHLLDGNWLACNVCVNLQQRTWQLFPEERELASMEDWLFLLRNLQQQDIYITGELAVMMREHPGRSMANNKMIMAARQKATGWALRNLQLNEKQRRRLQAGTDYFCAIHAYLDHNRKAALQFVFSAIRAGHKQKQYLVLLCKILAGRKNISRIKKYAG